MSFWPVTKKVIKDADAILMILDARMPELSRNEELEKLAMWNHKPFFRVFNKIDLISKKALYALRKKHGKAFFVSGTKNIGISGLKKSLLVEKKKSKKEDFQVGIVGYPNMGKSAIINALSKRGKTKVSGRAGTTKGIQWVKAGNLRVIDSPGVVPFEDKEMSLVLLGSKNPEKLRYTDKPAYKIIDLFVKRDREALEKFYKMKIEEGMDEYDILLEIGRKKGFLQKKAQVDERRTEMQIIRDWQSGKLRF